MVEEICDALNNRTVLRFHYDGGERTVEPYVYGTTRAGVEVLRGYQTSGFSQSGKPEGWKLFRVEEIADLRVTAEPFTGRRSGYKGTDPTIISVHCQVEESPA